MFCCKFAIAKVCKSVCKLLQTFRALVYFILHVRVALGTINSWIRDIFLFTLNDMIVETIPSWSASFTFTGNTHVVRFFFTWRPINTITHNVLTLLAAASNPKITTCCTRTKFYGSPLRPSNMPFIMPRRSVRYRESVLFLPVVCPLVTSACIVEKRLSV